MVLVRCGMKCNNCGHDVDKVNSFCYEVGAYSDPEKFRCEMGDLCEVCEKAVVNGIETVLSVMRNRP
jgi:hypothetical protein